MWTPDCPWNGVEFFQNSPLLCTAEFLEVRQKLLASNAPFAVYNTPYPREGEPFDKTSHRWAGAIFAPAYDDDPRPDCTQWPPLNSLRAAASAVGFRQLQHRWPALGEQGRSVRAGFPYRDRVVQPVLRRHAQVPTRPAVKPCVQYQSATRRPKDSTAPPSPTTNNRIVWSRHSHLNA